MCLNARLCLSKNVYKVCYLRPAVTTATTSHYKEAAASMWTMLNWSIQCAHRQRWIHVQHHGINCSIIYLRFVVYRHSSTLTQTHTQFIHSIERFISDTCTLLLWIGSAFSILFYPTHSVSFVRLFTLFHLQIPIATLQAVNDLLQGITGSFGSG